MSVALRCEALSLRLPGQALPVIRDASMVVPAGQTIGVYGRSGCGKTTLLRALAGLIPWASRAEVSGAVLLEGEEVSDLDPAQRAHLLATCGDRPEAQLFLATTRQELTAAGRLHGDTPELDTIVEGLEVGSLLDRRIMELSSGERQRVALAVALVAAPRPVLLDEPTAHLDDAGVAGLASLLERLNARGGAVLVVEQAGWRLGNAVHHWFELKGGELSAAPVPSAPLISPPAPPRQAVTLVVRSLSISRGGRPLLVDVNLELHAGEIVLLSGPNGSGKSTLVRALGGHARLAGATVSRDRGWLLSPREVALMLPATELQLFADTVVGELALAGAHAGMTAEVLHRHRLDGLAGRAPWTLSRGERQRLLHGTLDALDPGVMILDEPGQGLDPQDLTDLADLIRSRAEEGRTYLIATHRRELARLAHRHLCIANGRIVEVREQL